MRLFTQADGVEVHSALGAPILHEYSVRNESRIRWAQKIGVEPSLVALAMTTGIDLMRDRLAADVVSGTGSGRNLKPSQPKAYSVVILPRRPVQSSRWR